MEVTHLRGQEEPATAQAPYPPAGQAWYCVAILALATATNFLDRGILNLLVEPIKHDLHLTDVQMSLVMGFAFTFFYAAFGLPVARLIDRKSRRLILAVGYYIFGVMTMACGLATSFTHLFLARMGLGVGETTSGPGAYSLLSDYFPPHRLPRAITVMQIGFVLGSGGALVLGAAVIDFVAHHPAMRLPLFGQLHGWQMVLMLISLPGLAVATLLLTMREPPRRHGPSKVGVTADAAPIGAVFGLIWRHRWVYVPLFIGMGLRSAQSFGTQGWSAAFFSRSFGWAPQQYGYVGGLAIFIAMPIGLFLGNWLAEHYWKRGRHDANVRVVVITTAISVPFGIAFPLMPNPILAVICMLVSQATSIAAAAPENAAVQSVTPNRLRGQVTFLFLFLMNVVGMGLGPYLVAAITQYGFGEAGLRYSLALVAVIGGVPALISFRIGQKPYAAVIETGKPLESGL
ncbi:MFS transporter [Sphingomonas sp. MMS24-J13]|uniref:MFS transporter n=1 Tax=Sphingomonas sp. MMS24-J13 TaxID=3238686 RepID=UPI00384E2D33